eukprot:TRINITY_DN30733_c0_g1_i3.p2 TRINITY_DN30733_c0_g1~~TRINITY_DN30733_c0_g1_i3.p2  ORF type:complete len:100 (-),score=4.61 TRINITY_DN30733_c0_g1_i3:72-371(-)
MAPMKDLRPSSAVVVVRLSVQKLRPLSAIVVVPPAVQELALPSSVVVVRTSELTPRRTVKPRRIPVADRIQRVRFGPLLADNPCRLARVQAIPMLLQSR